MRTIYHCTQCVQHLFVCIMEKLSTEKRAAILRMTGVSKPTVLELLELAGEPAQTSWTRRWWACLAR
jgi:hypothetical protein